MKFIKDRKSAVIGMLLCAFLWSTGGLFIKLVEGNPIAISGARSGIAALFLLTLVKFRFIPLTKPLLIGTICYAVTVLGFVTSTKLTTSANAVLLQYIAPVWVAVFSGLFLKDRLRRSDFVSIAIMLIGLRLFFTGDLTEGKLLGNIAGLITSFSFAGYFIVIKKVPDGDKIYPTIYGNIITFIVGIPFLSSIALTHQGIGSLLFLGIVQIGLAYALNTKSMIHLKALDGVLIPVLEPLLNPVWVFLIIGERPSSMTIIGGVLVITSVLIRSIYQNRIKK